MEERIKSLDRAFNPRSVAVVGDRQGRGFMWLRSLSDFKGKVYSVQIDPEEIKAIEALGVENFHSLVDIPGPVDYVIVSVPRALTPQIVEDCIKKQVGGVTFFSSGFAETDTEEGRRLQQVLTERARAAGLNLIGPNCLGIFNPAIGLRHNPEQYQGEGGSVGFIGQSGTHTNRFSLLGYQHGIKVSKSVSYGNAIALDSPDYLEYFAEDEQTKIIGLYIEGVKDGRRLVRVLRQVTPKKPVVIWKAGLTEAGAKAAAAHTAALAESKLVWDAVMKQCGAIRVDTLMEMIDTVKGLLYIKPGAGGRVGLVAMSGGQSVVIADSFAREGLEVPRLSDASYKELASFFNPVGGSYRNPLDIVTSFLEAADPVTTLLHMLRVLESDDNVDTIALEISPAFMPRRWTAKFMNDIIEAVADFRQRSAKPLVTILTLAHLEAQRSDLKQQLLERGLTDYPTFECAARALKKVVDYYKFQREAQSA